MVAVAVGVMSVAAGIGLPIFYESQIDNAVIRFIIVLSFSFDLWMVFFDWISPKCCHFANLLFIYKRITLGLCSF